MTELSWLLLALLAVAVGGIVVVDWKFRRVLRLSNDALKRAEDLLTRD